MGNDVSLHAAVPARPSVSRGHAIKHESSTGESYTRPFSSKTRWSHHYPSAGFTPQDTEFIPLDLVFELEISDLASQFLVRRCRLLPQKKLVVGGRKLIESLGRRSNDDEFKQKEKG